MTGMQHLAEGFCRPPMAAKKLRHGLSLWPGISKMPSQAVDPKRSRTTPKQQMISGRSTNRLIAIRHFKTHATGSQAIHVRSASERIPITSQSRFQVIHQDHEDIGFDGGIRPCLSHAKKTEQERGQGVKTFHESHTTAGDETLQAFDAQKIRAFKPERTWLGQREKDPAPGPYRQSSQQSFCRWQEPYSIRACCAR